MPKVSIGIPAYNRGPLIKETIESVLSQSFSDFELFVIDDGSTDGTGLAVRSIKDSRLKYFYQQNRGRCHARNQVFNMCSGDYIFFLDHDDLWPKDFLKTVVTEMDQNPDYGVGYTRIIAQNYDGNTRELGTTERQKSGWLTKDFFKASPCMLSSGTCFRREIWKDIYWDEKLTVRAEDFDVFVRASVKTPFLFIPQTYLIKRDQKESQIIDKGQINLVLGAMVLERFYKNFEGSKYISKTTANRKISNRYYRAGKIYHQEGKKQAAIFCYKRSISSFCYNLRAYIKLTLVCLSREKDKDTQWKKFDHLPPYITVTQKNRTG